MLLSVWHTSWTVSDLDRSVAFYRDLLGFELVGIKARTGPFIETVVGFEGADLRIAMLRIPGAPTVKSGHHLELIEYVAPRGTKLDLKTCNVGAAHLALETDAIHALHERLSRAGVTFVSAPVRIETGPNPGGYACYLRDPDGFTIELVQPPPPSKEAMPQDAAGNTVDAGVSAHAPAARHAESMPSASTPPESASSRTSRFDLEGRVALVTGAARGLGAAMAEALADAGAHVVLNDIDEAGLDQRCGYLAERGMSVEGMTFDVTDAESVASSMRDLAGRHGRLDVLVNNAGIAVYGSIEEHGREEWNQVMDVDLTSLFILGREAAAVMRRSGYGRIINISSVLGLISRPGIVSYVVAKHGVVGLTRSMAAELGGLGITCNAIAPGYFRTPMGDVLEADRDFYRMIVDRTPLRRWGEPEELQGPVVFLASPASSFINGHVLVADGGITASLF